MRALASLHHNKKGEQLASLRACEPSLLTCCSLARACCELPLVRACCERLLLPPAASSPAINAQGGLSSKEGASKKRLAEEGKVKSIGERLVGWQKEGEGSFGERLLETREEVSKFYCVPDLLPVFSFHAREIVLDVVLVDNQPTS